MLLVGYLPFDAENKEEIVRKILKQKFETNGPVFEQVSDEAKDLLKRILVKKRSERIKMLEI